MLVEVQIHAIFWKSNLKVYENFKWTCIWLSDSTARNLPYKYTCESISMYIFQDIPKIFIYNSK